VMVMAIDQDHLDRGVAELTRGVQPAEATPDDQHPRLLVVHAYPGRGTIAVRRKCPGDFFFLPLPRERSGPG
jgi:hypothetical protein